MYAYFKKLDFFSTECSYSPNAYRGYARAFLKDLERIRPSAIIDIIHSGKLELRLTIILYIFNRIFIFRGKTICKRRCETPYTNVMYSMRSCFFARSLQSLRSLTGFESRQTKIRNRKVKQSQRKVIIRLL